MQNSQLKVVKMFAAQETQIMTLPPPQNKYINNKILHRERERREETEGRREDR